MISYLFKSILLVFTFCMLQQSAAAQERVIVFSTRGSGAPPVKRYEKYIRLIDADTHPPVGNYKFTYLTRGKIIGPPTTDADGYAVLLFTMADYYKKVEINLNDGKYIKPEWKDRYDKMRNAVPYVPLKKTIKFPSKISKKDTVTVLIKKM